MDWLTLTQDHTLPKDSSPIWKFAKYCLNGGLGGPAARWTTHPPVFNSSSWVLTKRRALHALSHLHQCVYYILFLYTNMDVEGIYRDIPANNYSE